MVPGWVRSRTTSRPASPVTRKTSVQDVASSQLPARPSRYTGTASTRWRVKASGWRMALAPQPGQGLEGPGVFLIGPVLPENLGPRKTSTAFALAVCRQTFQAGSGAWRRRRRPAGPAPSALPLVPCVLPVAFRHRQGIGPDRVGSPPAGMDCTGRPGSARKPPRPGA